VDQGPALSCSWMEAQKNVGRLEAKELALAEEKATFF
jgi:hypothetical protein